MLQMHQSALRGPAEHFPPLSLCCQDTLVISHGTRVFGGKKAPLTKQQKDKYNLFPVSFCIVNTNLSVKSRLESVILPSLLLHIKSLSLSALILDTLDWTVSTG